MPHALQRNAALRFCLTMLAWLGCLFAWLSVLSFHTADPPSTDVWPVNAAVKNLCGPVGATLAFYLFHYLGVGVYALLTMITIGIFGWSRGIDYTDVWLRLVGLGLICVSVSSGGAIFLEAGDRYLLTGPGGAIGSVAAQFLIERLETAGSLIVLAFSLLVGLILSADQLVITFARWLLWAGQHSGPVVARSGALLSTAGAAVASGVANMSNRLATAGNANGATLDRAVPAPRTPRPRQLELPPADDETPDVTPAGRPQTRIELGANGAAAAAESKNGAARQSRAAGDIAEPPDSTPTAMATRDAAEIEQPAPAGRDAPRPVAPPQPVVRTLAPKPARPVESERMTYRTPNDSYRLPALDLLDEAMPIDKESIEILCREKAFVLEQTLNEFRLEVQVVAIETGPVITVFELRLSPGIKVSQIVSLSNDLARALKAPAVRVVAPLPGKNTIGIEVPNTDKEKVRLKDLIVASGGRSEVMAVPLFLGKDAAGQPLVTDLTRMPHLLVAGTTGSGKSVCISSIVMSILMSRTPDEVNLILIDPKVVELAMFKDVPHLMCPIVTEVSKAEGILDWAATKMDERYALLAEAGVKDIRSYNKLGIDGLRERLQPANDDEMAKIPVHLPYIVIIVDELADLMMTSAKEVEFYLCRLAQKSRAVGIHLIVSTQRPQANVVTGLIKSNLPSRIAFRVSSRLDSRIVLDQNGGEVLMGQGDMLFLPPGSSKLMRAQGTFISDEELRRLVKHCKEFGEPKYHPELVRLPGAAGDGAADRDELFDEAVDIILETGRGSVSLLQRRLTIGYGRASRLVDQMHLAGIVGDYKGSQAREVIVTREEWQAMRGQRNREEAAEEAELPQE